MVEAVASLLIVSSFLQLVETLLREPGERAAYLADPSGYLPSHGFGDFTNEDVELSLQLVADAFPPALAELLDPAAGLDTIVAVDINDVPDLLSPMNEDDAMGLDDIVGEDDPFLDDESDAGDSSADVDDVDSNEGGSGADSADGDVLSEDRGSLDAEIDPMVDGSADADTPTDLETDLALSNGSIDSPLDTSFAEDDGFSELDSGSLNGVASIDEPLSLEDAAGDDVSELFD